MKSLIACLVGLGLCAVATGQQVQVMVRSSTRPATGPADGIKLEGANIVFSGTLTIQGKTQKVAFLGISASPVSPALREQLSLPHGIGLVVDSVEPGSPAEAAGLKQYDVLRKLDDQLLVDAHQLTVLVRMHKPGDEITLTAIRAAAPRELKAKLVEREMPVLDDIAPWQLPVPAQWQGGMELPMIKFQAMPGMKAGILRLEGAVQGTTRPAEEGLRIRIGD